MSVRLNASAVLRSGLGAPARMATPMPTFVTLTGVPATTLPCLARSSSRGGVRMTTSRLSSAVDLPLQRNGRAEGYFETVRGRAFELRSKLLQDRLHANRSNDLDFGSVCHGCLRQQ